jgi:carboxyl-terminal processing protease
MQAMLGTLGQSHFQIIPRELYEARETGGPGSAGIEVRILGASAVVTRVEPGSPADEAGVRPGWILKTEPLGEHPPLAQWMVANRELRGPPGAKRSLRFQTGRGSAEILLRLAAPSGRLVRFGHLPPLTMHIERRRLGGGGLYLAWSAFFDPEWLQEELKRTVEECGQCPGIVLDIRGNLGGVVGMAASVAGWFVPRQETLGVLTTAAGSLKLVAFPRPHGFSGKLALLVDGLTLSTAEFLAAGLKDLGRARLFGEKTPGVALPSQIIRLPTGDALQYATAQYVSAGGEAVEGRGVRPDVFVPLTREALLSGRDPVLEAAQSWLNKEMQ